MSSDGVTGQTNVALQLAKRPVGLPSAEIFERVEEPVADPGDGELLVKVSHISLDPAMRGWMNEGESYVPPVQLGEVMRALGAGEVVASRHPDFAEGQSVVGLFGVQRYARSDGRGVDPVDPSLASLPTYLGALGMPGMTAYFGLLDVGAAQAGDTVVVSAAAGAVGSTTGQIAKNIGCRVIGIAGGPEKCRFVIDELGFDEAIDYKNDNVRKALRQAAPDGIDVYFDNVGGEILDAALANLARGARVVICGAISQYNAEEGMAGPRNYMMLLVRRARMEGFVVFDYADRYGEARRQLAQWLGEGRLRTREDVVRGRVEDFPDVLVRLFRGDNVGKLVLELSD